jgi:hypothetical protein
MMKKNAYLLVLVVCGAAFVSSTAFASIGFDANSNTYFSAVSSSLSHTITGSNTALLCAVSYNQNGNDDLSSVTVNAIPLTRLGTVSFASARTYLYGVLAPPSGADTIIVLNSTSKQTAVACTSYTGVAQTGLPDSSNTGSGLSTSLTVSVTTVADNAWVIGAAFADSCTYGVGTNTYNRNPVSGHATYGLVDTNADQTPAGSYSLVINGCLSDYHLVLASLAPFTGGGGGATSTSSSTEPLVNFYYAFVIEILTFLGSAVGMIKLLT